MNQKQNKTVKKTQIKTNQQNKLKQIIQKKIIPSIRYGRHVVDPFGMGNCHIPDVVTQPSGLVQSLLNIRTSFNALTGTAATHAGGMVIYPYPYYGYLGETSAGNNVLTDLSNATGTTTSALRVPNYNSLAPQLCHIRMVSCGIRITYEGTELNRAGRYIAALLPIQSMDAVLATTGTQLSALGPINGTTTITPTQILNSAEKYAEVRISDGAFEAHWLPRGQVQYKNFSGTNLLTVTSGGNLNDYSGNVDGQPGTAVSVAGSVGGPNPWNSVNTEYGSEVGQYALVVIFDGDTTSSAVSTSNVFGVEIIWNWEVIPRDPTAVAYQLTPSIADVNDLYNSLNFIESASIANVVKIGGKNAPIYKARQGNF